MHIHSITKVLALPLVLMGIVILYWGWNSGERLSILIMVPAVLLVVLYVFHGLFDHWWLSKFPIPFDPQLKSWLIKYFKPYGVMDAATQNKFEYRLGLYLNGRLFQSMGSEIREVPEDVKCMVAAHGVYMFLGKDDYLIGDIDRIFLYKHPFPSPDFPFLHNVEVNTEDGVIILSMEQLKNAVIDSSNYYNTAYHAYAESFLYTQKNIVYPDFTDSWLVLENISGWPKELFHKQTGIGKVRIHYVFLSI